MPDRDFSSWEELVGAVDKEIKDILIEDVAPVAKEIMRKHIESDIYGAYTPKLGAWVNGFTYQRRNDLEDGVVAVLNDPYTLFITNVTHASPSVVKGSSFRNRDLGAFLQLLESGNMGIWANGFPRPAVSNTQNEFDTGDRIPAAISYAISAKIGPCEIC